MNIKALQEKRARLNSEMKAIADKAVAEGRGFTDLEEKALADLKSEAEANDKKLKAAETALELERATAAVADANEHAADAAAHAAGITVRDRASDDPNRGYRTPREFIEDVMAAGRAGARVPERLMPLRAPAQAAVGSDEGNTQSDPYGGFLVPTGFSPTLLSLDAEPDPMAGRVTMVPMATPILEIPYRVDKDHTSSVSGGLTVTRRVETQTGTSSRPEVRKLRLQAFSLFGLSYATEEMLQDSAVSFAALLAAGFRDEFNSAIIDERLNGTGVGQFLGALLSPALITVTKETGQAADTVVTQNILKMRQRVWRYQNAIWLANQNLYEQLFTMTVDVGTGGELAHIFRAADVEGGQDTLLGRPIFFSEYMATLGDANDIGCFNWSQFLEGIYEPLQSAESIHVRFIYHERTFKFWLRNAGAPWWDAALTPKKGSTLSPFVVLGARA